MQNADFNWFVENHKDFYNKYGASFLAIKNKTILGVYDSFASAVKETSIVEELGTFIVQECDPDESSYTCYIAPIIF